jgi:DNA-binding winged helix-turn-helix (wHTH) protein
LISKKTVVARRYTMIELRPMAVSVLQVLVEHTGEVLAKEQLMRSV